MSKKEEKPRPIDVEKLDMERLKKMSADLPGLIEYAHSVGGFTITKVDSAGIATRAIHSMQEQTSDQLEMLMQQMKVLAEQAQDLKSRVDISQLIHKAEYNFKPVPGECYYLYLKSSGCHSLSLIAPAEWRDCPHEAQAKVQLNRDNTWKILERYADFGPSKASTDS